MLQNGIKFYCCQKKVPSEKHSCIAPPDCSNNPGYAFCRMLLLKNEKNLEIPGDFPIFENIFVSKGIFRNLAQRFSS
jgi:hypothetical protein